MIRLASALAALGLLAGCGGEDGHYHVNKHPMIFAKVTDTILPALRKPPLPVSDPNNPNLAQEVTVEDPNDPMQAMKTVLEAHGTEWIFPGKNRDQLLRVRWVYGEQNYDDSMDIEVHAEVRTPYAKAINGQQAMVTQDYANRRIQAAVGQMVDTVNADTPTRIAYDPTAPALPLVSALRDLLPWDAAAKAKSRNPWS